MIIKEIELNNFRIYKGLNKVDLRPESGKNIFVVSGRNGFGKTTFLMSLVWCLYGKQMHNVDDLYEKEISDQGGYNKYIGNSLNRLAKSEGETRFHVSITFSKINIPDLPCNELKITRMFDIVTSSSDSVSILVDGYPNEMVNDIGTEHFIRDYILPNEIAKFFFFDAEKIVTLAEINTVEQRRKLSLAYSEVLGIKKYEDLKKNLEELQLKLRQDSASEKEQEQLRILKAQVENCEDKITSSEKRIEDVKEKIQEKRKESNDIQEKLIRAGSTITVEELNALRGQEKSYNDKLVELQNELKDQFDIIPFAIAGGNFLNVSKQLEIENNYRKIKFQQNNIEETTEKVLTDLLNEPKSTEIVIENKIHDYYTKLFKKLIRKHFFANTPELDENFQVIHDYSDSEKLELQALLNSIKFSFKESFKRINGDVNQSRNELNIIKRKIRDAETHQEDPIIEADRKHKEEIDKEIIRLESDIRDIDQEIGETKNDRTQKIKRIEEISKKLEVSAKNKDKDDLIIRHIHELKEFISKFKEEKKKSLEQQIFKGLETLMHKKGFVHKVKVAIAGDDIDIILYNQRKEEIKKETLSKGEQQMYATALLRGLVEESDIDFPVFIDSPMQKFDEQHAENIVKYFYPNVSEQVVIFPLVNKELTAREYNILSKNIKECFIIDNVHEDKSVFLPVHPDDFLNTYNRMYNNAD